MGKHNKPQPKKISFLGATAGAFGALVLAGGLFAATQVTNGEPPIAQGPKHERQIPQSEAPDADGLSITSVPNTNGRASAVINVPAQVPARPVVPPASVVEPPKGSDPTAPPGQTPENRRADVSVEAEVNTPPVASVDTELEVHVPLLAPIVEPLEEKVIDPVTDLLDQ